MSRLLAPRIVRRVRPGRVDQRPMAAACVMPVGGGAVMVVAGGRELSGDRRVDRRGLAIATELRIGQAVARLAVVGIDDVTARAARMADRKSTRLNSSH